MIDLTPIKQYLLADIDFYIILANKSIDKIGFDNWFNNQLSKFLDCSKLSNTGHRVIQTNFKHYSYEITTIVEMIEIFGEDNKDNYYERLLQQHNNNLEFEAIHGFEYIDLNDNVKKTTKRRKKQTSIDFDDKPIKETAAERKLKAHVAKIQSLNIKLKPVRNANTL